MLIPDDAPAPTSAQDTAATVGVGTQLQRDWVRVKCICRQPYHPAGARLIDAMAVGTPRPGDGETAGLCRCLLIYHKHSPLVVAARDLKPASALHAHAAMNVGKERSLTTVVLLSFLSLAHG